MFFLSLALAASFDLNDAGLVFDLPGWQADRWTDWDLRAQNPQGPMALEVWYTDWQATMDEESNKKTAAIFRSRLEAVEKANNIRMETSVVETIGGRPTGLVTVRFNFDRVGARGILFGASFANDGRTIHLAFYGPIEAEARILAARTTILNNLKQTKPPSTPNDAALKGSFGQLMLPEGWRAVLPSEEKMLAELASKAALGKLEGCIKAVKPDTIGAAALMTFCPQDWQLGILDTDSFVDREPVVRERLYGKAATQLTPGDIKPLEDRTAILYSLSPKSYALEVALVPYERSVLVAQALELNGKPEELRGALLKAVSSVAWSGAENGKPQITLGEELAHAWNYSMVPKVALAGVAGVAALGLLRLRKKPDTNHYSG